MAQNRCPISPEELGIYLSCLQPTRAYNLPLWIPLGKGDYEKAKNAFADILEAHPYLFMQLSQNADGDVMKGIEPFPFTLEIEEAKTVDKGALVQPFELLGKPLFRAKYYRLDEGDFLFVDFHHVLMDGFSLKKFLDEFASRYQGKAVAIPTDTAAMEDSASKAKRRGDEALFAANKDYFLKTFDGLDVDSSLVEDHKDPEVSYKVKRISLPSLTTKTSRRS